MGFVIVSAAATSNYYLIYRKKGSGSVFLKTVNSKNKKTNFAHIDHIVGTEVTDSVL